MKSQSAGQLKVINLGFIFRKAKSYGCCVSVSLKGVNESVILCLWFVCAFFSPVCTFSIYIYICYIPITYTKVFLTSKIPGLQLGEAGRLYGP